MAWPYRVFMADSKNVLHKNGLDAYSFLMYLQLMLKIIVPIWLVSWIVLLPIDAARIETNKQGLDRFTFGNISASNQTRYGAHLAMAWIFTCMWLSILVEERGHNRA